METTLLTFTPPPIPPRGPSTKSPVPAHQPSGLTNHIPTNPSKKGTLMKPPTIQKATHLAVHVELVELLRQLIQVVGQPGVVVGVVCWLVKRLARWWIIIHSSSHHHGRWAMNGLMALAQSLSKARMRLAVCIC